MCIHNFQIYKLNQTRPNFQTGNDKSLQNQMNISEIHNWAIFSDRKIILHDEDTEQRVGNR